MWDERVLGFMGLQAWLLVLLILSYFVDSGYAYTPAQPSNSTHVSSSGAADSTLDLWWWPRGTLTERVSYQMAANDSTGTTAGPLLQFHEERHMSDDTTTTPWVALISCDKKDNNTEYLPNVDIFTLAWERGAVAALLYSNSSQTCVIDEGYLNETAFERLIDVFSVETLDVTHIIHEDYAVLQNMTFYVNFNATLLNDLQALVNQSLEQSSASEPGFLYARLQSFNTTVSPNSMSGGNPPGRKHAASTAMIVGYSIIGVVSALFCIVIVIGVIRAIRHPERYTRPDAFGVRPRRRTVIVRAILDTFPVIKCNRVLARANVRRMRRLRRPRGAASGAVQHAATQKIIEVRRGHHSFRMVDDLLRNSWHDHRGGTAPQIRHIYKVVETSEFLQPYNEYRNRVGNEQFRFHGTIRTCLLGATPTETNLCTRSDCAVCNILRTSYRVTLALQTGAFGQGIYTSSASNKAFGYSQNTGILLLNKVALGREYHVSAFAEVNALPSGYDSVVFDRMNGALNETVLYDDAAIRPVFLIVF